MVGKFKDETSGKPIIRFVGNRAKMYCYEIVDKVEADVVHLKEKRRAKGIQEAAALKLVFEDYKKQLDAPTENYVTNRRIGSKLHQLYSIEIQKRGLCGFDDKRYLCEDGIHTLALGHHTVHAERQDLTPENTSIDVLPASALRNRHIQLLQSRRPTPEDEAEASYAETMRELYGDIPDAAAFEII